MKPEEQSLYLTHFKRVRLFVYQLHRKIPKLSVLHIYTKGEQTHA